ncbi:zinc-regulated transporter 2 [Auricularia subglabra TFB-10046 SS5]|nr:zinc-regulated transporter 2 [Auricularia subglabra TFB-10046 SS5]
MDSPPPPPPPFGDPHGPPHPPCGPPHHLPDLINLRIASIFVLLVASTLGAVFPILVRPTKTYSRALSLIFDFAKYFGSGVIIATAFIHLLAPSFESLSSECLHGAWQEYTWAPALAMFSVFCLFFVELFAFRIGTRRLQRANAAAYDPHGHNVGDHGTLNAHGPELAVAPPELKPKAEVKGASTSDTDLEHAAPAPGLHNMTHNALAQIIGVAILEFGVVFHSVLVGLTLAVDKEFRALFVVITLHQTFEGLALGARLATLNLPGAYQRWVPLVGAIAYGCTTPIGIAVGLAIRSTYSPEQPVASMVSGVFDAVSAGVLLYTGLVELLAHEFLFNPHLGRISDKRLLFACLSMVLGAALMSLLGRWV